MAKDDHRDIDRAEDGELVGLFEKATLALEEGPASMSAEIYDACRPDVETGKISETL